MPSARRYAAKRPRSCLGSSDSIARDPFDGQLIASREAAMSMGKKFRTLLKEKKFITSMGIDTPVHAKIVEKAGFDYAYLGGYDVSLALLGLPDMGLITET